MRARVRACVPRSCLWQSGSPAGEGRLGSGQTMALRAQGGAWDGCGPACGPPVQLSCCAACACTTDRLGTQSKSPSAPPGPLPPPRAPAPAPATPPLQEATTYYFDVTPSSLRGALERFAQFFCCPLVKRDALEREVEAVDNEFVGGWGWGVRGAWWALVWWVLLVHCRTNAHGAVGVVEREGARAGGCGVCTGCGHSRAGPACLRVQCPS